MTNKEYGYVRNFVALNADFIASELENLRTIKSIWKELIEKTGVEINYTSFVYNVSKFVTNETTIARYQSQPHSNNQQKEKDKTPKGNFGRFDFNAQSNEEDLI